MTKKTMTTTTRVLLFKMAASSCQLSIVSLSFVVLFVQISTCQVSSDTKRSDVKVDAYVKELNESEFQQFINRSSVGIVYFQRKDSRRIQAFLREYEKSAEKLHTFGVQLGRVSCHEHPVAKYCKDDRSFHNAFGFRDGKEKIALPLDTLFDVDSIVSSALHLALIHNVPIIQSHRERKSLENKCKGRFDIIFTFQRALGTYEHRVFMELAFTFLDKYVFAMTTYESAVQDLRRVGHDSDKRDDDGGRPLHSPNPVVWVLSCQDVFEEHEECPQSVYFGDINYSDMANFVQALDYPLWIELPNERHSQELPYNLSDIHLLYLISDDGNYSQSLIEKLATAFRGCLSIVVILRSQLSPDDILKLGVFPPDDLRGNHFALRLKRQTSLIWIPDHEDVEEFILRRLQETHQGRQEIHSDDEEVMWSNDELAELHQDDVVAEYVRLSKASDILPTLTETTYTTLEKIHPVSLVIFYLDWDPTCKVTVEILHHLHEMLLSKPDFSRLNPRPFIAKLDCFDWPAVCQENNVSVYPTLKIITGTDKRIYLGPLEATSILRALLLYQMKNPMKLNTYEEGIQLCQGQFPSHVGHLLSYVMITGFPSSQCPGAIQVQQLGVEMQGTILIGFAVEDVAKKIEHHFGFDELPFVVLCKPKESSRRIIRFSGDNFTRESLIKFIEDHELGIFDEITPLNFPLYHRDKTKDLLMHFRFISNTPTSQMLYDLASHDVFPRIRFTWISMSNELVEDLSTFYKLDSSEEAVLRINFSSGVFYALQGDALLGQKSLRDWLNQTSFGTESSLPPSGRLSRDDFKPLHPGVDYLRLIDEEFDHDFDTWMASEDNERFEDAVSSEIHNGYQRSRLRIPRLANDKRHGAHKMPLRSSLDSGGIRVPRKHVHSEL